MAPGRLQVVFDRRVADPSSLSDRKTNWAASQKCCVEMIFKDLASVLQSSHTSSGK